jgi:CheY-like chemotaxis protein
MYYTIENPDLKMMEELYKNKKLIEKNNEDTSNFLFRITQDIKRPVKDIIEVSSNVDGDLKSKMKYINNTSISLDYLINDALDVSSMNTKRIKVYDTRYNALNLFKEEKYKFENRLNKNVKFNFTISNGIPEYLYGDSLKLKQVISSVLENALEHTEKGEITLDISSIIKYGICRLIISITDSGKGMGIEEINNILSLNSEDMAKIDLRNMDDKDLNLKEVKKLVALIGGNLMVKSEEGRGTEINIILEQKIVPTKETEITKKLESYEQSLYHNKKVMVVDDDAKELASITSYLEKNEAIVSGSLFGRDCIEKIEANMKYDLILLDDETDTYSALEVLKELKKNKKFNIPVVIMIDDSKEFIKLHYLQDGFSEVIMKSKLESEIDRIMKRF